MREEDLVTQALEAVKQCFSRVPGATVSEAGLEVHGIDAALWFQTPGARRLIVVETRRTGDPQQARGAALTLLEHQRDLPGAYGVFVAPYISPRAQEILAQHRLGAIDLAGNCRLAFDNVYVELKGHPNPNKKRSETKSLFGTKSTRVLRCLLEQPDRRWRVQELADIAEVSLGLVSAVKQGLEAKEWLDKDERGLFLREPRTVLQAWADKYDGKKNRRVRFYSAMKRGEIEEAIDRSCRRGGRDYAFTAFSAAARYAPRVRYRKVSAYAPDALDSLVLDLGLEEVDSGANVELLVPYDAGVLYQSQTIDGARVVSKVQCYLDLLAERARGEEAAEALLRGIWD